MIRDVYKVNVKNIFEDVYKINTENKTYYDGSLWLTIDFEYVELSPPSAKIVKWENNEWVVVEEYPTKIEPQPPTELETLKQDNLMLNEAVTEMTMLISMILEGGI